MKKVVWPKMQRSWTCSRPIHVSEIIHSVSFFPPHFSSFVLLLFSRPRLCFLLLLAEQKYPQEKDRIEAAPSLTERRWSYRPLHPACSESSVQVFVEVLSSEAAKKKEDSRCMKICAASSKCYKTALALFFVGVVVLFLHHHGATAFSIYPCTPCLNRID